MCMWLSFLDLWNSKSFFYDVNITESADMEMYMDASGSKGYGGYFQGKWFSCPWPDDLNLGQDDMSIAFMELVPIVTCATIWGHNMWAKKRILFHCDNMATVGIINKERSKSHNIMKLMRRLTWCAIKFNFVLHAVHIKGRYNILSDCLSRLQVEKFRELDPLSEQHPTATPPVHELYLT
ncbi:hypothetical protein SNE40_013075 [Patella caerulea]|uniref:Uncharacterized protein n=1 Tax=Patella caerulea TaxID=87958 RepID=A0AAN8JK75_PATCE